MKITPSFIVAAIIPLAVLAATPTMTSSGSLLGSGEAHVRGGKSVQVDSSQARARNRKTNDRRSNVRNNLRNIRPRGTTLTPTGESANPAT